jgi:hypothetical protein
MLDDDGFVGSLHRRGRSGAVTRESSELDCALIIHMAGECWFQGHDDLVCAGAGAKLTLTIPS